MRNTGTRRENIGIIHDKMITICISDNKCLSFHV